MSDVLTRKERAFLCRFLECRNISAAAAECGIPPGAAREEGLKILRKPAAAEFAAEYAVTMKRFGAGGGDIIEDALGRLINGSISDAVILARSDPETLSDESIRKMDLYNVSELKFGKGVCEIKFADRLKAVEKLNEIKSGRAVDDVAQSFFNALDTAAQEDGGTPSPPDGVSPLPDEASPLRSSPPEQE